MAHSKAVARVGAAFLYLEDKVATLQFDYALDIYG